MVNLLGQHSEVESLNSLTGDFLIPEPADRIPCMIAFKKYLAGRGRKRWDVIKLNRFCAVSEQLAAFQECFPEAIATKEEMPGFMLEFPDSWDALATIFKGKTVKNLRRSLRLLEESSSSYEFMVYEQINDTLLEELAKVHTSRQMELVEKGRKDRDALFADNTVSEL